jgi:lysophospholipase L1-like esterase
VRTVLLRLLAAAGLLSMGATLYVSWRMTRRRPGDVVDGASQPRRPGERRVVCAGDSLTRGTMSYDYVEALRGRLGAATRVFNAGVDGDLAFNLAERLPSIVACDPDDVVVLIGTNDLCGAQTPAVAEHQRRSKKLPELPTQESFEKHLTRFLAGLRAETAARILVVTPPLLGEDLSHPVHTRLCTYAERITQIANEHGAQVIPFHDAMAGALRASGHAARPGFHPGPTELSWMAMVPLQRYLVGMSYDRIARGHGLWGSADLVHLSETSGAILVDLVEGALRAVAPPTRLVP